ncbi:MAG: hypothetical protein Q4D73_01445 [Actinomycetaceae bacterium]|nr:hypothetical protein [Actinomycetaceae bacterium]
MEIVDVDLLDQFDEDLQCHHTLVVETSNPLADLALLTTPTGDALAAHDNTPKLRPTVNGR